MVRAGFVMVASGRVVVVMSAPVVASARPDCSVRRRHVKLDMSEMDSTMSDVSLPHALLGLLAVEPRSGYELTKAFEADLGRYAWQAGHTSIYPELNRPPPSPRAGTASRPPAGWGSATRAPAAAAPTRSPTPGARSCARG